MSQSSRAWTRRLLGTKEIAFIHHTDCGMLTFTDDGFKAQIHEATGIKPEWAAEPIPRRGPYRGAERG